MDRASSEQSLSPRKKITTQPMPPISQEEMLRGEHEALHERKKKRWSRFGHATFVALGISSVVVGQVTSHLYALDVGMNAEREKNAAITLTDVYINPNADKTTVVTDGFNAYDGYYLTKKMLPAFQELNDGNFVSLDYNNAILSREAISEAVINHVNDIDTATVDFMGYSMGGVIGIETASDIVTQSNKTVEVISLIQTPSGFDGLRPYQQEELSLSKNLLAAIPGAEYSSAVRYIGEVYFYRDNYLSKNGSPFDARAFQRTIESINTRIEKNNKMTSMNLLTQQIYKIDNVDYEAEFQKIAAMGYSKQLPVITYFRTKAPAYDSVVDDKESSKAICEAAQNAGLTCIIIEVDDLIHAQYQKTIPQFEAAFSDARPVIDAAIEENRASYQELKQLMDEARKYGGY